MRYLLISLIFLCISSAALAQSLPAMTPYTQGSTTVMLPQGWQAAIDEANGVVYLQENSADPHSPTLAMFVVDYQAGMTPDSLVQQYLQSTSYSNVTMLEENRPDPDTLVLSAQAQQGTQPIRMAIVSGIDRAENVVLVAVFTAPNSRFEGLGGTNLLLVSLLGVDPQQLASASAQNPAVNTLLEALGQANQVIDVIIKWYSGELSGQPLLSSLQSITPLAQQAAAGHQQAYLAFEQLIPSLTADSEDYQAALFLRDFSFTGYEVFTFWHAFLSNSLPALQGGYFEQNFLLPEIQQTYDPRMRQFMLYLAAVEAIMQGQMEVAAPQIDQVPVPPSVTAYAAQGGYDASDLANVQLDMQQDQQYWSTMSEISAMMHDTNMTIINNMGGGSCIIGVDYDCY